MWQVLSGWKFFCPLSLDNGQRNHQLQTIEQQSPQERPPNFHPIGFPTVQAQFSNKHCAQIGKRSISSDEIRTVTWRECEENPVSSYRKNGRPWTVGLWTASMDKHRSLLELHVPQPVTNAHYEMRVSVLSDRTWALYNSKCAKSACLPSVVWLWIFVWNCSGRAQWKVTSGVFLLPFREHRCKL